VEKLLRSVGLVKLLEKIDTEYAVTMCQAGCSRCKGKLHRTDYPRKPRGFAEHWTKRFSFCCAREGCRKRYTPSSVRFLGRRVYVGVIVVLVSALAQGVNAGRVQIVRRELGMGSSDKFLSGAMKVVELEEEKTFIAIAISGAG